MPGRGESTAKGLPLTSIGRPGRLRYQSYFKHLIVDPTIPNQARFLHTSSRVQACLQAPINGVFIILGNP